MNKNLQKVIYFLLWWNILLAFRQIPILEFIIRFDFVFVLIPAYYLFKEVFLFKLYKNNQIPRAYKILMAFLLIWVFINIFREPPINPKGFARFLGGRYYVAAWFPLLFFYIGSKITFWNQIWHYAIKFNKLLVQTSPLLIILFISGNIWWPKIFVLIYLLPLLFVNWNLLSPKEQRYLIIGFILALLIVFIGGSRADTLRLLFYIPVLYFSFFIIKQHNRTWKIISMGLIMIVILILSYYVYTLGISNNFNGEIKNQISKFEKKGFENSRDEFVYPDFFADMNTSSDWILGRGLNGSYFSEIFVGHMEDLNESNSLKVKKGYRTELECGYLQTILKIGLIGLVLKLILAISAVFLGLFRSNNWFVKGCAFIIIEWLISMYPAALPEWSISYILFWLSIGACLSRETRLASSSLLFIFKAKSINKNNKSFFNINYF